MTTDTEYRRRNSLRYGSFDYTAAAAYFVTICAHKGETVFGIVCNVEMQLSPLGTIATHCWREFGKRHDDLKLDAFVVMPNHVHLLLWLGQQPPVSQAPRAKPRRFGDAVAGSLSVYVGAYNAAVTRRAMRSGLIPGPPVWQRNFYDHIVRNDPDLQRIRDYINANPARWLEDQLHPEAPPNQFNRMWLA